MLNSFYKQFGNPAGFMGNIVGKILAANNKERTGWVLSFMDVKPDDKILEIGYGPGLAIEKLEKKIKNGLIVGVDVSEVMLKQASRRNFEGIKQGKVKLYQGTINNLNYKNNFFNHVFGINVSLFWKDPVAEFKKIRNLLKPGASLLIALQPRYAKSNLQVREIGERVKNEIIRAGFTNFHIQFKEFDPIDAFCIWANP